MPFLCVVELNYSYHWLSLSLSLSLCLPAWRDVFWLHSTWSGCDNAKSAWEARVRRIVCFGYFL
jgi:hypothetical protein